MFKPKPANGGIPPFKPHQEQSLALLRTQPRVLDTKRPGTMKTRVAQEAWVRRGSRAARPRSEVAPETCLGRGPRSVLPRRARQGAALRRKGLHRGRCSSAHKPWVGAYPGRSIDRFSMGRHRMDATSGVDAPGSEGSVDIPLRWCDTGPRNPDGTWVAGVVRDPYKLWPLPIGTVFGELTVVRYEHYRSRTGKWWGYRPVCRCSCGAESLNHVGSLKAGRSTRCNKCAKRKANTKRFWKYRNAMSDDVSRTRLLNRLSACIGRCHKQTNKYYKHYGERGISVCAEWRGDRMTFLRYVQTLSGWDSADLEMDRVNVDGNYEPGNIRFVSKAVNAANKRQVTDMQRRILDLEAECANLRSSLRRAEEQIYSLDRRGTADPS